MVTTILLLVQSVYLFSTVSLSTFFFFFNDTATTEIYTLSLHDALPIWARAGPFPSRCLNAASPGGRGRRRGGDRKSTRLDSSHVSISYAVFCLKKKNKFLDQLTYNSF